MTESKFLVDGGVLVIPGSLGIVARNPVYVRQLNKDGTLGREFTLLEGARIIIRQIDVYRDGILAQQEGATSEFFIPFSEALLGVDFHKPEGHPSVGAVYVGKVLARGNEGIGKTQLVMFITFTAGVILGAVLFGLASII